MISFSFTYAYVFFVSSLFKSLCISFTTFAILIWADSIETAEIIAFLFPFAPACASPLKIPTTTTFSPATTSAPAFTSPNIKS